MGANNKTVNLPTEFINEKSIATLSGATLVVLLVCWVINYTLGDTLNYKVYRAIGLALSLAVSILLTVQQKEKKPVKWIFTILNGCLIFSSVSGLNVMSASYMSNPTDTADHKKINLLIPQQSDPDKLSEAGLIALPRMTNWWPDEQLVSRNIEITNRVQLLEGEKLELERMISRQLNPVEPVPPSYWSDSLQLLRNQLAMKEDLIVQLKRTVEGQNNSDCEVVLASRLRENERLSQALAECNFRFEACQQKTNSMSDNYSTLENNNNNLASENERLGAEVRNCRSELRDCRTGKDSYMRQLNAKIDSLTQKNAELTRIIRGRMTNRK